MYSTNTIADLKLSEDFVHRKSALVWMNNSLRGHSFDWQLMVSRMHKSLCADLMLWQFESLANSDNRSTWVKLWYYVAIQSISVIDTDISFDLIISLD